MDINQFILKDVPLHIALVALTIVIQKFLIEFFTRIFDSLGYTLTSEKYKSIGTLFFVSFAVVLLLIGRFSLQTFLIINLLTFLPLLFVLFLKFKQNESASLFELYSFRFSIKPIGNALKKYCNPLLIFLILQYLIFVIDRNLLQIKRGSYEQGLYGFSLNMTNMIMILISAMIPLFLRQVAILNKNRDMDALCSLYNKVVPSFFLIVCYFVSFIIVNAEDVIVLIGGEKYENSKWLLIILMFSTLAACYSNFNNCLLYTFGRFGYTSKLLLFISPISIIYSFLFIYYYDFGALSLVIKSAITEFVMLFLIQLFIARRIGLKIKEHILFGLTVSIIFLSAAFLVLCIGNLFELKHYLIRIFLFGTLYTLIIGIIYFLFPAILHLKNGFGYHIQISQIRNYVKRQNV